jgi:hypothetical protein
MIAEIGIMPTIREVLFKENTATGILAMLSKGGSAVLTKDAIKLMQMLIDVEMKMFNGLDVKVVFLQNIVVDLILGFDIKEIFIEYCTHIRKKYKAVPGFITQNMPYFKNKLQSWGIKEVVICSSFNKIGYLMSPDVQSYVDVANNNNPQDYHLMAMSILASGAIPAKEANDFINKQKIQSVVFGASGKAHIVETLSLIQLNSSLI